MRAPSDTPAPSSGPAAWLEALPEALPVAIAVTGTTDGTLLYANRLLGTLLGRPVEQALGRSFDDFYAESTAREAILAAVVRDGSLRDVELRGRRADSTPVWVLASFCRIRYRDEPEAVLAAFHDITDRRRAEAALAELAKFPEMNPGPVLSLDRDGIVLLANAAARRIFGDTELVGRCWLDVCPGIDREAWKSVVETGAPLPREVEIGGVSLAFTHVRTETGQVVFVYGADVTARRRDERLLAEQAATLAEIARFPDMNPGPVLRLDLDGSVLLANAAARGVFGAELVGRSWREICPGIDAAVWQGILEATGPVPLEAHVGDREYVFAHRRDPNGRLVFVFGADVSQQKRAERALRQSEKMATLGTLAAGVAHELNNPAAATRRAAEQLRDAFARLEQAHLGLGAATLTTAGRELLRSLEQQARERAAHPDDLDALARSDREAALEEWLEERGIADPWELAPSLVGQGLDLPALSRLAAALVGDSLAAAIAWLAAVFPVCALSHEIGEGSARISEIVGALKSYSYLGEAPVQWVDVHEGLDNTLVILRNKLKAGITVHRDYGADVPKVPAYGSELNQVWTNLLDNATDAMGGKGRITIRTRRQDGWTVVEIEDDGPGIPEAIQSRIFDPFFTTKAPGRGTGLGLSTSYGIVTDKHKGEMRMESRPGFTRFTVRLPVEPSTAVGAPTNPTPF